MACKNVKKAWHGRTICKKKKSWESIKKNCQKFAIQWKLLKSYFLYCCCLLRFILQIDQQGSILPICLCAYFTSADPKSCKKTVKSLLSFVLLGSSRVNIINIFCMKMLCTAFLYLHFNFAIFCTKILTQRAHVECW